MPSSSFQIATGQTRTAADAGVSANGDYDLFVSAPVTNVLDQWTAARIVIDYEAAVPDWYSVGRNWDIFAVIEANNGQSGANQRFFPIAYQFEPYRNPGQGKQRVLLFGQQVPNAEGVDDIVYIGGVVARISRQSSKVLTDFRVRLSLREYGFGTPQAFQSVTVSIYGDLFNG